MTIYKFRVMYEEDDGIFRDIEIKPSQTLSDFESIIVSSYNLPVNTTGQFFKSNDNWQRLRQLSMVPVPVEDKKSKSKARAQALPILVAYIDDPHQKFIYEYHGSQEFVFLIELMSLNGAEKPHIIYPLCVRQQGPSPFKKEDLVAHYTRGAAQMEAEEQTIDDEEDDLESMNLEGETEEADDSPMAAEEETESETVAEEPADEEEDFPGDEMEDEEFGEEEAAGDFTEETDD